MDVEIERTPEALDKCHRTSLCEAFRKARFVGQVRGDGAVDDAQHLAHDGRLAGEQKAQWERYAEHPLAHRLVG